METLFEAALLLPAEVAPWLPLSIESIPARVFSNSSREIPAARAFSIAEDSASVMAWIPAMVRALSSLSWSSALPLLVRLLALEALVFPALFVGADDKPAADVFDVFDVFEPFLECLVEGVMLPAATAALLSADTGGDEEGDAVERLVADDADL